MEAKNSYLTKDLARIIILICFNTNEIKNLFDSECSTSAKNIFNCHDELNKKIETLIASSSKRAFVTNIESVRKSIQHTLYVYENIQIAFDYKEQLTNLFKLLDNNLEVLHNSTK